ncbi:MAG: hypothetical protein EBS01_11540 [Verrucomicrobia bacterium]|nr:hypothetical protein [Verrucomicrobiota bacterium]
MDKTKPTDWLAIKPKSIITISDAQGIQDSMRRGLGVRGLDYTVRTVAHCEHINGLSSHVLITLEDTEQAAFLMVKAVDGLLDLFVFFDPPGLTGGERPDLLGRGMHWLFQEPPNPDSFDPAELRYTASLSQQLPGTEGGAPRELRYFLKAQGELQCHYSEVPARAGLPEKMLATLAEYRCEEPVENPEFLVLEVGEARSNRSYVRFFLGCQIRLSEVDVLSI